MQMVSLRLPEDLLARLESEAKVCRMTKSRLVRESLEKTFHARSPRRAISCYDLASDLAGRCDPVLTEAAFLLKREGHQPDALFALLERGVIRVAISIEEDLRALMNRYRNRPMSLADACLARLSELHAAGEVFTLDSDFRIYRRHGNKVIPFLVPE
jgi:predicted nucleic acid-binding protein